MGIWMSLLRRICVGKKYNNSDMRIIRIYGAKNDFNVPSVVEALKAGKTLVYPTETVYGLGCDATNQEAVDRVFQIKQRQKDKAVLVLMSDIAMAQKYAQWNPMLEELAEKYWPGPLTVVAKVIDPNMLAKGTIAKDGTAAFRVTSHPVARQMAESLGKPLVSTSANIASMDSPYDIEEVKQMFANAKLQPDIVIDAGVLPDDLPSTIVSKYLFINSIVAPPRPITRPGLATVSVISISLIEREITILSIPAEPIALLRYPRISSSCCISCG